MTEGEVLIYFKHWTLCDDNDLLWDIIENDKFKASFFDGLRKYGYYDKDNRLTDKGREIVAIFSL